MGSNSGEYVLYVNSRHGSENTARKSVSRIGLVSGFLGLIVVAGFACVYVSHDSSVEMVAKSNKAQSAFAVQILKAAIGGDNKKIHNVVSSWRDHQISSLHSSYGNGQMLRETEALNTILVSGNSSLCTSKAKIIAKLNEISNQISDQLANLNATDAAKLQAKISAHQAYLDTEASFRLMEQKEQQAKEGSEYASDKYEKWAQAVGNAQDRYNTILAEYNAELPTANEQKALLQSIVTMLSAVKGSSAASADSGVVLGEIHAKINLLKQIAKDSKDGVQIAGLSKKLSLAQLNKLADSVEVVGLIQNMIDDIDSKLKALSDSVASASSDLEAHKVKLAQYQQDVVDMSNAADQAHHEAIAAKLQRQQLLGNDVSASEEYASEHANYELSYGPAAEQLAILDAVVAKVQSICA